MVELSTPLIMPVGVIIAGGQSRRFQSDSQNSIVHQDKFLMDFGADTVLGHIIARAKGQISPLWLNVNGDLGRVSSYDVDAFSDEHDNIGPLGGILAALKKAKVRGFSHIVTLSGDSPFFPDDFVTRMVAALSDGAVKCAIAHTKHPDGNRPHPIMGIFSVELQDSLTDYIEQGERRVMEWVRQQGYHKVIWDNCDPDPFFNINHPEDLAKAERYLGKD